MSDTNSLLSFVGSALSILTNSPLKLGGVGFQGMEIPERMPFGGKQQTKRKTLIGGLRSIQALGPDEDDVTWSGRFTGSNGLARATAIDNMRIAGLPVSLVWGTKNLIVIVTDFKPDYEILYQIPYSITCAIISTKSVAPSFLNTSITDLVGADVSSSLGLSNVIGNATIGQALSTTQSVLATLGPLTGSSVLGQAGQAIGSVQAAANLVSSAGNSSLQGLALGVANVAGTLPTAIGAKITGAASSAVALANSVAIGAMMTRSVRNVQGAS